jgi:methyl-accepting chemotaxis protein
MVHAANRLSGVVVKLNEHAGSLSAMLEQASAWAEDQRKGVGRTARSMDQMNEAILDVAKRAGMTADGACQAKAKAQDGARIVGEVVAAIKGVQDHAVELRESMSVLGKEAEDIGQVIGVISDIADQTNLLALNAAIESARAGEAGRGFAVVADEVRKLAEKTMSATKQVGRAVGSIQERARSNMDRVHATVRMVGQTSDLAGSSGEELRSIAAVSEESSLQVQAIASASEQQSASSDEIKGALDRISALSDETAHAMHRSSQAVQDIVRQSAVLRELILTIQGAEAEPLACPLA